MASVTLGSAIVMFYFDTEFKYGHSFKDFA